MTITATDKGLFDEILATKNYIRLYGVAFFGTYLESTEYYPLVGDEEAVVEVVDEEQEEDGYGQFVDLNEEDQDEK